MTMCGPRGANSAVKVAMHEKQNLFGLRYEKQSRNIKKSPTTTVCKNSWVRAVFGNSGVRHPIVRPFAPLLTSLTTGSKSKQNQPIGFSGFSFLSTLLIARAYRLLPLVTAPDLIST